MVAPLVLARPPIALGRSDRDRARTGDRNRGVCGLGQHRRVASAVQRRELRCVGDARPPSHAQPGDVRRAGHAPRCDHIDRRSGVSARRHRTSRRRQSGRHRGRGWSRVGVGPGSAGGDDVRVATARRRRLGPRRQRAVGRPDRRQCRARSQIRRPARSADRGNGSGRRRPRRDLHRFGGRPGGVLLRGARGNDLRRRGARHPVPPVGRSTRHQRARGDGQRCRARAGRRRGPGCDRDATRRGGLWARGERHRLHPRRRRCRPSALRGHRQRPALLERPVSTRPARRCTRSLQLDQPDRRGPTPRDRDRDGARRPPATTRRASHADRRAGGGAGHRRRTRRRDPRGQCLRGAPQVVPTTPRPPHTVPIRGLRPSRPARNRDPDRRQRDPGLAGAARRADRGHPYWSPGRQDQSADRLDRPSPAAGFDHNADADPQRAAYPAPHGADRRRCRRRDHRSGGGARDARQFRSNPRSRQTKSSPRATPTASSYNSTRSTPATPPSWRPSPTRSMSDTSIQD